MVRRIYHGSKFIVEKPKYGLGKTYNDYGLGFYCTEEIKLAKEWAVNYDSNGYANCYELDFDNLNVLYLNAEQYCILHWLAILLENRSFDTSSPLSLEAKEYILEHFKVDYKSYDVIIGYRADDSYFSFAQDFLNGTISYRQLTHAMHLGKLGEQIVIKSKKAFENIRFVGYEAVESKEWYAKRMLRDKTARREYFDMNKGKRQKGDLYITHILDEEMDENDLRLR